MNREKIENQLFNLKMAILRISDIKHAENAAGDIAWYIYTGRASCDYIRTFCNLSKYRLGALARKISGLGCTDEVVTCLKKYFKIS